MTIEKIERLRIAALTAHDQFQKKHEEGLQYEIQINSGYIPPDHMLERSIREMKQRRDVYEQAMGRYEAALAELGISMKSLDTPHLLISGW